MAIMNIKPEVGVELATSMNQLLNGQVLDTIAEAFAAAKEVAGESTMMDSIQANFQKLQNYYNNDVLGNVHQLQQGLQEYTDYATFLTKVQAADSVQEQDVGGVTQNQYDACASI